VRPMLDWFLNVSQDDNVTNNAKPKRRSFRFSLRTLLIFMLVVGGAAGWKIERVRKQREVVAWVHEMGGRVTYEPRGSFLEHLVAGPEWLRERLGRDFFDDVQKVLLEPKFSLVSDVSPLANLTKLETLDLYNTQLSDLSQLVKLTNLKKLTLYNTQFSDLSPLAKLTNLESLGLNNAQVSDVSPLANLTKLEGLDLSGTGVSDVSPLAKLTELDWLMLSNTQVSDVSPLANLTKLEHLYLHHTQVSEEAIEQLKKALPQCSIRY